MNQQQKSEIKLKEPSKDNPRFIVMPFQPGSGQEYNGTGLALHFLLGNVMAVHTLLKEFWFGWRVNKLFEDQNALMAFCKGQKKLENLAKHSDQQGIRFWLNGNYIHKNGAIHLELNLFDFNGKPRKFSKEFILDLSDKLIEFRNEYLKWLSDCSLSFPQDQVSKIMWPETITQEGLNFLGNAMAATYINYVDRSDPKQDIDLEPFERSVIASPHSYLTWDMHGWGLYKNKSFQEAEAAFLRAIKFNKQGLGALS
ncbi:MAG: hypothetical protein GY729_08815, partial [Desulfobacteraceae bacterium]|nr:hypothetical protein [Desulfobacteraceae bacterium]